MLPKFHWYAQCYVNLPTVSLEMLWSTPCLTHSTQIAIHLRPEKLFHLIRSLRITTLRDRFWLPLLYPPIICILLSFQSSSMNLGAQLSPSKIDWNFLESGQSSSVFACHIPKQFQELKRWWCRPLLCLRKQCLYLLWRILWELAALFSPLLQHRCRIQQCSQPIQESLLVLLCTAVLSVISSWW